MSNKYMCITETEAKNEINKAEIILNECFNMLMDFRHCRGDLVDTIIHFQPRLAECLSELMIFYKKLQKEKNSLVALKNTYPKEEFSNIMEINARFSVVVRTAIEIGKNMGDAFSWFFFKDNKDELRKHFMHRSTGLYVSGIGGQGELEFLKNNTTFKGLYVLYHGITSMLRIGDFSLYDFSNGIIGTGELKSKIHGDILNVYASVSSKFNIKSTDEKIGSAETFEDFFNLIKQDFPKLEKQLKDIDSLWEKPKPTKSMDFASSYDHVVLNSLTTKNSVVINNDNSLIIIAEWCKKESLFETLWENEEKVDFDKSGFKKIVKSIVKQESLYNAFFIGELNIIANPLSIPVLWWDIDETLCRDLYFNRLKLTTVFNPATIIQFFIDDGFSVTTASKLEDYKIYKDFGNKQMTVGYFDSLCFLITNNLMKSKDAYSMTKKIINSINNDYNYPTGRFNLNINLYPFGKE